MKVTNIFKTTNEIATLCKIYMSFTNEETPAQQDIYLNRKLQHRTFIYTDHLILINYSERKVTIKHRATNLLIEFDLKKKQVFEQKEIVKGLDVYMEYVEDLPF